MPIAGKKQAAMTKKAAARPHRKRLIPPGGVLVAVPAVRKAMFLIHFIG
ncbi:hypothetical protein [Bradyrhizobium sp. dw_411]|nr:hypothetical protein [Bradyrhizobium sp. dw_411]